LSAYQNILSNGAMISEHWHGKDSISSRCYII